MFTLAGQSHRPPVVPRGTEYILTYLSHLLGTYFLLRTPTLTDGVINARGHGVEPWRARMVGAGNNKLNTLVRGGGDGGGTQRPCAVVVVSLSVSPASSVSLSPTLSLLRILAQYYLVRAAS